MAFNLARAFASVFKAIVKGMGDLSRRLMSMPSGHLARVAFASRDIKNDSFKKLLSNVQGATKEDQAKFMLELPGFVRYVARMRSKGRNKELIARRPSIKLPPSAFAKPAPRQAAKQKA